MQSEDVTLGVLVAPTASAHDRSGRFGLLSLEVLEVGLQLVQLGRELLQIRRERVELGTRQLSAAMPHLRGGHLRGLGDALSEVEEVILVAALKLSREFALFDEFGLQSGVTTLQLGQEHVCDALQRLKVPLVLHDGQCSPGSSVDNYLLDTTPDILHFWPDTLKQARLPAVPVTPGLELRVCLETLECHLKQGLVLIGRGEVLPDDWWVLNIAVRLGLEQLGPDKVNILPHLVCGLPSSVQCSPKSIRALTHEYMLSRTE